MTPSVDIHETPKGWLTSKEWINYVGAMLTLASLTTGSKLSPEDVSRVRFLRLASAEKFDAARLLLEQGRDGGRAASVEHTPAVTAALLEHLAETLEDGRLLRPEQRMRTLSALRVAIDEPRTPEPPDAPPRGWISVSPAELAIRTPSDLATLLRTVMERAGLSPGPLAQKTKIHRSQVYLLIKPEKGSLPRNPDQLSTFMTACRMRPEDIRVVLSRWEQLDDLRRRRLPPELAGSASETVDPGVPSTTLEEAGNVSNIQSEDAEESTDSQGDKQIAVTKPTMLWGLLGWRKSYITAAAICVLLGLYLVAINLFGTSAMTDAVSMISPVVTAAVAVRFLRRNSPTTPSD